MYIRSFYSTRDELAKAEITVVCSKYFVCEAFSLDKIGAVVFVGLTSLTAKVHSPRYSIYFSCSLPGYL